jgi:hypothetical protein
MAFNPSDWTRETLKIKLKYLKKYFMEKLLFGGASPDNLFHTPILQKLDGKRPYSTGTPFNESFIVKGSI